MAWRVNTFLEIQQLVTQSTMVVESFDLYNGQLDSYRGDTNEHDYLAFPCVLLEFVGGDWEHDQERRIAKEYFFRLHYVCEENRASNSSSGNQRGAIAHLDHISVLANLLDLQSLTCVQNLEFVREEIDTAYTNIINHTLDFVGCVTDDSLYNLKTQNKHPLTKQGTQAFFKPK